MRWCHWHVSAEKKVGCSRLLSQKIPIWQFESTTRDHYIFLKSLSPTFMSQFTSKNCVLSNVRWYFILLYCPHCPPVNPTSLPSQSPRWKCSLSIYMAMQGAISVWELTTHIHTSTAQPFGRNLGVQYLGQGYINMQTGEDGDWTTNHLISRGEPRLTCMVCLSLLVLNSDCCLFFHWLLQHLGLKSITTA